MILIKNQMHLVCILTRLKHKSKGFGLSVNEQAVLIAIADKVNHLKRHIDSWCCYPSVKQIAEETNQGERTVHRAIANLSELDFIEYKTGTQGKNNLYKIDVESIGVKFNYPMRYATDVKNTNVAHKETHKYRIVLDDDDDDIYDF